MAIASPSAGQGTAQLPDASNDFERCRTIGDDAVRLRCYEDAASSRSASRSRQQPAAAGAWRLVRTPNPAGGRDAVSIMRTADVSRSDLDFAGLMLRCGDGATEVLVVVVRPFPPRAHPRVTAAAGGTSAQFTASVIPPGALVLLPPEAAALAAGPWQAAAELTVVVTDEQGPIRGVIPLAGMGAALHELLSNCSVQ